LPSFNFALAGKHGGFVMAHHLAMAYFTLVSIATRDETLRCKTAGLDLIAYEAKYHSSCLLKWQREYGTGSEELLQCEGFDHF